MLRELTNSEITVVAGGEGEPTDLGEVVVVGRRMMTDAQIEEILERYYASQGGGVGSGGGGGGGQEFHLPLFMSGKKIPTATVGSILFGSTTMVTARSVLAMAQHSWRTALGAI